jgi:hypothetical protein
METGVAIEIKYTKLVLYYIKNVISVWHKKCNLIQFFHISIKVSCCFLAVCWTHYA